MSEWLKELKIQFGDAVTAAAAAFAIQGVSPACVCAPENEAQAAAVIRFAAARRVPVVPCGGGTEQGRCAPPPSGFLALSTTRMNRLIHHEPGDMVATVQGGMPVGAFQDAIAKGGQWLPIDAALDATIGGIVAANTHGPRAHGYGTLRDMILGMSVINGDGMLRKCGGKVVKNVTGYSLDKLYIGSMGTLGLITEVTFKLRPLSVDGRYWIVTASTRDAGIQAMQTIAAQNLPFEMLEMLSPEPPNVPNWNIMTCAAGTEAELERIELELKGAVPDLECKRIEFDPHFELTPSLKSESAFKRSFTWARSEALLIERASRRADKGATLRFGCVASKLTAACSVLRAHVSVPQAITLSGGIIDISPLTDAEAARIAAEFEKLGVNFAFENVVGVNIPSRWGSPRPEWALMKQIKSALDPQGIMNPGRFVV